MKLLADHIRDLPPELFDQIYRLTFTASGEPVAIRGGYRPPACLQVNQATRAMYAASYYSNMQVFIGNSADLHSWGIGLEAKHRLKLAMVTMCLKTAPFPIGHRGLSRIAFDIVNATDFVVSGAWESGQHFNSTIMVPLILEDNKTIQYACTDDMSRVRKEQIPADDFEKFLADLHQRRALSLDYAQLSAVWEANGKATEG